MVDFSEKRVSFQPRPVGKGMDGEHVLPVAAFVGVDNVVLFSPERSGRLPGEGERIRDAGIGVPVRHPDPLHAVQGRLVRKSGMDMDFVSPRLQAGGYLDGVPLRSPGPDETFYQNGDLQLFPSLKIGNGFLVR